LGSPKGKDMGYRNGSRSDLISEESTGLCEQLQLRRFQPLLSQSYKYSVSA